MVHACSLLKKHCIFRFFATFGQIKFTSHMDTDCHYGKSVCHWTSAEVDVQHIGALQAWLVCELEYNQQHFCRGVECRTLFLWYFHVFVVWKFWLVLCHLGHIGDSAPARDLENLSNSTWFDSDLEIHGAIRLQSSCSLWASHTSLRMLSYSIAWWN